MPDSGSILDGYRLIRPIGRGGFGEVWLCQLDATRELKALKFLSSADPSQLERELAALVRYRSVVADLNCPHLVPVEHVNRTEEGLFYVMPLADGTHGVDAQDAAWQPLTLAAQIFQHKTATAWFGAEEIRGVMLPLMEAVRQLTATGVVHRDIKPDNILFFRGRPCLGDVGLLTDDVLCITRRGTPGYAAPSWYLETGGNPDMWGLATTLYTLITGNNPDKMARGAFLYPPQGKASVEKLSWDQFHHAIFRATNGDANERFLYIQDFARALNPRPLASQHTPGKRPKYFWITALFACALLATLVAQWLWHHPNQAHVSTSVSSVQPPFKPDYSEAVAASVRDFDKLYAQVDATFWPPVPPELEHKVQALKERLKNKVNAPIAEISPVLDELEAIAPQIKETQISITDYMDSKCWNDLCYTLQSLSKIAGNDSERALCRQLDAKTRELQSTILDRFNRRKQTFALQQLRFWFSDQRFQTMMDRKRRNPPGQLDAENDQFWSDTTVISSRISEIISKCAPEVKSYHIPSPR